MDSPTTTPALEAPATFTNADRALLMAIADKLNQPKPADLFDPVSDKPNTLSTTPPGVLSELPPPPAFDPPGSQVSAIPDNAAPVFTTDVIPAVPGGAGSPSGPVVDLSTAPVFEPTNTAVLAALPQPEKPAIPRDTKVDFTAGQATDLAAIVALVREKFPHSLPDEIPAVAP